MPKFTFICEHEAEEGFGGRVNSVGIEAETWNEVISEMTDFLHACGYQFKGELEMVEQETAHSEFYFDISRNR